MKAAVFEEFGGPDVLRIVEIDRPEPASGEVLLRVRAAAMNHLDLWVRRGLPIETTMPHIGGSDIAGTIESLGPGVEGAAVGDAVVVDPSLPCGVCDGCRAETPELCNDFRIIGEHTQGGFAEFVAVPAANLLAIPDGFGFERAAAAPLASLTAWRGLVTRARLSEGESVLVTGASGGVATFAIQIAHHLGARVHALTTPDHAERVLALGADVVHDRTREDWSRELWRATGRRGVDVVFDSVGAAIWTALIRSLAPGGRLVSYGGTTGAEVTTDVRLLFWRQLEILGTRMSTPGEFREAMGLVFAGELDPVVDVVLPLDSIREAHERLERSGQFGKLVLTP
jgi:NADPH:quinone reductase-like Zn-dependent oxidoreductase